MARVFVSHASEDRELAGEVHGWLTGDGHEVFLDDHPDGGIAVGEAWERRLYERLRWADAVVCLVTSAYLASPGRRAAGCCRCWPSGAWSTRCWSGANTPTFQ